MSAPLPSPSEKYDRQNEAETRRTVEQELQRMAEALAQAETSIRTLQARLLAAGIP